MKANRKIYLVSTLFFILACVGCSKDNEAEIRCNDIVITENVITSPQWLVEKIDSINTPIMHVVWVYSVMHNNQEYILLHDWIQSSIVDGYIFCTCSGHTVDWESENALWWYLYYEKNRTLLWKKEI